MKSTLSLPISFVALGVSLVAMVLALRPPSQPPQAQIDAMVDSRLAARERATVEAYVPSLKVMLDEMGEPQPENWSPQTYKELLAPLIGIMTRMSTPSETPTTPE